MKDYSFESEAGTEDGGFRRMRESVVTLVFGPPGSGKTTLVHERRAAGDLIWDLDYIMHAITRTAMHHTPRHAVCYAMAMREAFVSEAKKPRGNRIWIIEACPTGAERARYERELNAGVILLETPEHVCRDRVRDRGPEWPELVAKWFAASTKLSVSNEGPRAR